MDVLGRNVDIVTNRLFLKGKIIEKVDHVSAAELVDKATKNSSSPIETSLPCTESINVHPQPPLIRLLKHFQYKTYQNDSVANEKEDELQKEAFHRCEALLRKDYKLLNVNAQGITDKYPKDVFIIVSEHGEHSFDLEETDSFKTTKSKGKISSSEEFLRRLFYNASHARCRRRFTVPVIFYNNKYICRSSTVALTRENYVRGIYEGFGGQKLNLELPDEVVDAEQDAATGGDYNRGFDKALLHLFNVGTIVDLMVENFKTVKGWRVSSSEKVDDGYKEFNIAPMPYPGCEFFAKFREHNYQAENVFYDWPNECNAKMPEHVKQQLREIGFDENYRDWDIVKLTCRYVRVILQQLETSASGVLVHCISGWDRTPLFICILRIMLWADGQIHKSLDVYELLYFTIAYDWYLFGHHLSDRLTKHEDILLFAFYVLKFFIDDKDIKFNSVDINNENGSANTSLNTNGNGENGSTLSNIYNSLTQDGPSLESKHLEHSRCNLYSSNSSLNSFSSIGSASRLSTESEIVASFEKNMSVENSDVELVSEPSDQSEVDTTSSRKSENDASSPACKSASDLDESLLTVSSQGQTATKLSESMGVKEKTHPVDIPSRNQCRNRQDSIRSNESFHVVTLAGSVEGSVRTSNGRSPLSIRHVGSTGSSGSSKNAMPRHLFQTEEKFQYINKEDDIDMSESSETVVADNNMKERSQRDERLREIRMIFINVYAKYMDGFSNEVKKSWLSYLL